MRPLLPLTTACAALACLLAACGQTGPLYLPDEGVTTPVEIRAAPAPQTEPAAAEPASAEPPAAEAPTAEPPAPEPATAEPARPEKDEGDDAPPPPGAGT